MIQNSDGGFDYLTGDPEIIRNTTNASPANQFGLHGIGLLEAYRVTLQPVNLQTIKKTADVLAAKTIYRMQRMYSTDGEFLASAAEVLGFPVYRQKAAANNTAEKEHYAAIHILDSPNPTTTQVNAIVQAALDAVTDAQRAAACRRRLVEAGSRPSGLRAFDWGSRLRQSLYTGDVNYAREIAKIVAADFPEIQIVAPYYLLGLANTVTILKTMEEENPAQYAPVIASARTKLLAQQKDDGFFRVEPAEGAEAGNLQDAAFIAQALLDVNEVEALKNLTGYLIDVQLASGAYDHYGAEFVEAQSELMGSLAKVLAGQGWRAFELMTGDFTADRKPLPRISLDKAASPFI